MRTNCPKHQARGKLTREAALFLAVYGRPPTDFDPQTAMGLASNIPVIEARLTLAMARAIGIAFGSGEAAQQAVTIATNNPDLGWRIRMKLEHEKAVAQ